MEPFGEDIASKMLSALTSEMKSEQPVKEIISSDEHKRYLKRYIDSLSIEDRKEIGNILIREDKRHALNWCSEGTVINLDSLPANLIEQMYILCEYKINNGN